MGAIPEATLVLDAGAHVAESPLWDASTGCLLWVDIEREEVHHFDPSTGNDRMIDVGQSVGAVVGRRRGGYVLAVADGFAVLESDGSVSRLVSVEAEIPENRMNDGKCDPRGRFFAGTVARDFASPSGSLYRLDADLTVRRMLAGVWASNGMGWSLDGRLMYYVDSLAHSVDVLDFDLETGEAVNRRKLVQIPPSDGNPDGMTVDRAGYLWVAFWGGWAIRRFAPDGNFVMQVDLPVANVTSCAFGGPLFNDLYITTASKGLSPKERSERPHAGGIFRVSLETGGFAASRFAG